MARPARKQFEILAWLERRLEEQGEPPTPAEAARAFGITYPTLREHLDALAAKGHLSLESRGRGRSPRLVLHRAEPGVPLFGEIAAGLPIGNYPEPEGHLTLRGAADHFALRVRGNSMADRIEEGDVVLLAKAPPTRPGEICAVRVGQDEATLKYLDWQGRRPRTYRLRPHNPDYPTLEVSAEELHIDGTYRSLLRGEIIDLLLEDRREATA